MSRRQRREYLSFFHEGRHFGPWREKVKLDDRNTWCETPRCQRLMHKEQIGWIAGMYFKKGSNTHRMSFILRLSTLWLYFNDVHAGTYECHMSQSLWITFIDILTTATKGKINDIRLMRLCCSNLSKKEEGVMAEMEKQKTAWLHSEEEDENRVCCKILSS